MADNIYGTIKFKRGITDKRLSITPNTGEPIFDTSTSALYVGDGTTAGGLLIGPNLNFYRKTISGNKSYIDTSITEDCFVYYDATNEIFKKITDYEQVLGHILGFYSYSNKIIVFSGVVESSVFSSFTIGWGYIQKSGSSIIITQNSGTDTTPIGYCIESKKVLIVLNDPSLSSTTSSVGLTDLRRVFKQGVYSGFNLNVSSTTTGLVTIGSTTCASVAISNHEYECTYCINKNTSLDSLDFTSADDNTYNIIIRTKKLSTGSLYKVDTASIKHLLNTAINTSTYYYKVDDSTTSEYIEYTNIVTTTKYYKKQNGTTYTYVTDPTESGVISSDIYYYPNNASSVKYVNGTKTFYKALSSNEYVLTSLTEYIDTSIFDGSGVEYVTSTGSVYCVGAVLQTKTLDDSDILLGTVTKASSVYTCTNYESKTKLQETKSITKTLPTNSPTTGYVVLTNNSVINNNAVDLGTISTNSLTIDSTKGSNQKFSIASTVSTLDITLPSNALSSENYGVGTIYNLYINATHSVSITFNNHEIVGQDKTTTISKFVIDAPVYILSLTKLRKQSETYPKAKWSVITNGSFYNNATDLGVITTESLTIDSTKGSNQKFSIASSVNSLAITLPDSDTSTPSYDLYITKKNSTNITFSSAYGVEFLTDNTISSTDNNPSYTILSISKIKKVTTDSTVTKWIVNIINDTGYYIVGSDNLSIYIDDIPLIKGTNYTENGTDGTKSNTITLSDTYYPYLEYDQTINGVFVPAFSGSKKLVCKINEWEYQ